MVESNCAVRSQARTVIGDLLLCKFELGLELKALGSRVVTEPVGPKLARGLGHLRTQLSKLLVHTRIKGSPWSSKACYARGTGITSGTAHPGRALTTNSIVFTA